MITLEYRMKDLQTGEERTGKMRIDAKTGLGAKHILLDILDGYNRVDAGTWQYWSIP